LFIALLIKATNFWFLGSDSMVLNDIWLGLGICIKGS
jgi:hypothetical protein